MGKENTRDGIFSGRDVAVEDQEALEVGEVIGHGHEVIPSKVVSSFRYPREVVVLGSPVGIKKDVTLFSGYMAVP
jgi:hypothetical protein